MLQYVSIRKYKHLNKLNNIWNSEYKKTFPIKKHLYKKYILDDVNLNKDASFVALYDNEPVGFIFIKTWLLDSGLLDEHDTAHISLMYVKKEMRNMGIGSDMLNLALGEIKKHTTIKKVVVGHEVNFIFAGVPSEINHSSIFFINKGFDQKENVVDMIRVLREDSFDDVDKKGLSVSIATEEEKDELLKLCISNNLNQEAYKINQYFDNGGTGRRIAIGTINNKIVASASVLAKSIKSWINLKETELNDPDNRIRNVANVGHHGVGDYEFIIKSEKDFYYFDKLFNQSYDEKI